MVNLDGIQYPIFIGIGAVVSLPFFLIMAILSIFAPYLWPYVWIPFPVGMFIGLMIAFESSR